MEDKRDEDFDYHEWNDDGRPEMWLGERVPVPCSTASE